MFTHNEKLWFLWTEGADIYLAEMVDAVSIKKLYVHLTHPELTFECRSNLESGTGQRGRSVWAQTFTWDEEDFPVFGKPEAPQRTK